MRTKNEIRRISFAILLHNTVQGGQNFTICCACCEEFHYSASSPKVADPANESTNVLSASELADYPFYTNEHDQLVNTLKHFWETESIGIKPEQVKESTRNSFIKDLSYDGKRYVVGLPWKKD